jgi:hypothetical protein
MYCQQLDDRFNPVSCGNLRRFCRGNLAFSTGNCLEYIKAGKVAKNAFFENLEKNPKAMRDISNYKRTPDAQTELERLIYGY